MEHLRGRLEAGADLTACIPAPGRPRRHRGPPEGAVPRPGGAHARLARVRASAARLLTRLCRAPRAGAAARHLGAPPPGLQHARHGQRARPLHDPVPAGQRVHDRHEEADGGAELGDRPDPRRRRPPSRARARGRSRPLGPRALQDGAHHPAADRLLGAPPAARGPPAAGDPVRAARVVPGGGALLRPRGGARHARPERGVPRAHDDRGGRGGRGPEPRRLHRPGHGLQRGRQRARAADQAAPGPAADPPDARAPRAAAARLGARRKLRRDGARRVHPCGSGRLGARGGRRRERVLR